MRVQLFACLLFLCPITLTQAQQPKEANLITNSAEKTSKHQVSPEYVEALKTLFTKMHSDALFKKSITQMVELQKGIYTNIEEKHWAILEEQIMKVSINDLITDLAPIYAEHLSIEDLEGLIKFFNTPLGQKYALSAPYIMEGSMEVGYQWGLELGEEIGQMIKELEESEDSNLGL